MLKISHPPREHLPKLTTYVALFFSVGAILASLAQHFQKFTILGVTSLMLLGFARYYERAQGENRLIDWIAYILLTISLLVWISQML